MAANHTPIHRPAPAAAQGRVVALDTLRGFTIVSMVAFHTAYDLAYLFGQSLPWFTQGPLQEIWRISISWVFLALAGWMTAYSRNNLKRAALYGVVAAVVWLATTLVSVDTPISFGIIFCMAASTLLWDISSRMAPRFIEKRPACVAAILIICFLALYTVPRQRYDVAGLAWLGLPDAAFSSSDYYPIIPFSLLYLAFAVLSHIWHKAKRAYPNWMMRDWIPPVTSIGRTSLLIYVLHQPVILVVLKLLFA